MMVQRRIGYLGPPGTYSHQAALQGFSDEELIPCTTIQDCFVSLEDRNVDVCVVPFENSTNGSVVFTLDELRNRFHAKSGAHPEFKVVGEEFVLIQHSFLTCGAKDLSQVRRIYSHPQVWGQCDEWLNTHLPGVSRIDTTSTSRAVELVKGDESSGAIASQAAGKVHGVPVVDANVSNVSNNTTRFVVLSRDGPARSPGLNYGTIVSFMLEHAAKPGALCDALGVFSQNNVNLTAITSRPSGQKQWQYIFFVEFDGHPEDEQTQAVLKGLAPCCYELQLLGCYQRNSGA